MSTVDRRWRRTIVIKDLLDADESNGAVRSTAGEIAKRLAAVSGLDQCYELRAIIEDFEEIADPLVPASDLAGRFTLCHYFNSVLGTLYDWADAERVWIG